MTYHVLTNVLQPEDKCTQLAVTDAFDSFQVMTKCSFRWPMRKFDSDTRTMNNFVSSMTMLS